MGRQIRWKEKEKAFDGLQTNKRKEYEAINGTLSFFFLTNLLFLLPQERLLNHDLVLARSRQKKEWKELHDQENECFCGSLIVFFSFLLSAWQDIMIVVSPLLPFSIIKERKKEYKMKTLLNLWANEFSLFFFSLLFDWKCSFLFFKEKKRDGSDLIFLLFSGLIQSSLFFLYYEKEREGLYKEREETTKKNSVKLISKKTAVFINFTFFFVCLLSLSEAFSLIDERENVCSGEPQLMSSWTHCRCWQHFLSFIRSRIPFSFLNFYFYFILKKGNVKRKELTSVTTRSSLKRQSARHQFFSSSFHFLSK